MEVMLIITTIMTKQCTILVIKMELWYQHTIFGYLVINALRPVFTLKGNLKIVSGDGNSESTAYRLGI